MPYASPAVKRAALGSTLLKLGSHGDDVRKLQALLTKRGFKVSIDGWFGRQTLAAVMRRRPR